MGATFEQQYKEILQSFSKYLKENYAVIGFSETSDEYWIKTFLKDCDNKEWEI